MEYETSIRMIEPLVHKIINQEETLEDVISQVIFKEKGEFTNIVGLYKMSVQL